MSEIRLSLLFERKNLNGFTYFEGVVGGVKYTIYPLKSDNPKQPAFELCIGDVPQVAARESVRGSGPSRRAAPRVEPPPPITEDDMPGRGKPARSAAPPASRASVRGAAPLDATPRPGPPPTRPAPRPVPEAAPVRPVDRLAKFEAEAAAKPPIDIEPSSDDDFEDPFAEEDGPPLGPAPSSQVARPAPRKPATDRLL